MASKTKPSKREAILDAMLDIVVERGFHDAPMSLLSQRSGASAGVIYHYFASKEEIIQALYEHIRALKVDALLSGFSQDESPRETFLRGCLNIYNFYRKHQREMRFYDQCEHAGFACTQSKEEAERVKAFARLFSGKARGGVLNDWPSEVIQELTLNSMNRLASQPRKIPEPLLLEIAAKMWDLVKA
jgi:TetR/AcrR family transcriptional regulator, repressor of fatR-cypB operon